MVESLISLLEVLNTLSPLAVIGLLSVIIYVIIWKQPTKQELGIIRNNDLHELPQMAESLRRIEASLAHNFAYIVAKLESERKGR